MAPSPFASSTRQPWRWTNAWSPLAGPRQSSLDLQCSAFCGAGLLLLLSRLLPCHPTPAQGPTSATGSEGTRISGYRPSPFQHLKLLAKAVGDPPFARQAWYSATVMAVRLCALGGQQARPDTGSYCRQVVGGRQYRQLLPTGGGGEAVQAATVDRWGGGDDRCIVLHDEVCSSPLCRSLIEPNWTRTCINAHFLVS